MSRKNEPGWVKIGATCSAGRRSLWWRVNLVEGRHALCPSCGGDDYHHGLGGCEACFMADKPFYKFNPIVKRVDVASIELCAGREGDDAYVKIENDGGRQFYDLWDVLSSAEFAAGT